MNIDLVLWLKYLQSDVNKILFKHEDFLQIENTFYMIVINFYTSQTMILISIIFLRLLGHCNCEQRLLPGVLLIEEQSSVNCIDFDWWSMLRRVFLLCQ